MTPTDPEPYRTDVWDPEQVNPNSIGGGQNTPCDATFSEKCPCSHDNKTALIKQISLFDNHDKYLKFQFKINRFNF